jgi:hypothetical protein
MVEIRVARRADLPAIVELLNAEYIPAPPRQDGPTEGQLKAFEAIAAHPEHEIAVATLDGEVVGTLS